MNPDIPLQLLGGITAREFMRDYWQKKPLLVRQAIPGFESPISPDELAGLALEEEIESRLVIERGEHPWELRRGPFAEDAFAELPERVRIAVEMHRFGGARLREIAAELGVSVTVAHELVVTGVAHCRSRLR